MFARAGVRLSDDGNVQVVTPSCTVTLDRGGGDGRLREVLWRATPSVNADGLQLVTSSPGRNDGWSNEGGVSPSDGAADLLIGTERDGYQSVRRRRLNSHASWSR